MKAKLQLYRWLKKRYPETFLEKFIPKINQRPDILVNINGKYIAVEFQSSVISPHIVRSRNHGYLSMNIIPVWFISAKLFKRIGNCKIKIDRFTMEFLQNYPSDSIDRVYYYCPYRQLFLKVSSLHMTSNSHAFANMQYFPIKHITFPQLLRNETTEQKMYVPYWLKEKQNFRMKHSTYYGAELKWRKWLYNKGLYIHQLPAIVHLPIKAGYTFKVPPWQWQSYLVIGFLCPLALNQSFTLQKAKRFLHHLIKDAGAFLLLQTLLIL